MSNHIGVSRDAQTLAIRLSRLAMTLPEGVGLVTHNDSPVHPIFDGAGRIIKWLIYFRMVGKSRIQPPSAPVAGAPEGIIDLGEGWKVLKVIVHEVEIGNQRQVMERIQNLLTELVAPDLAEAETAESQTARQEARQQSTEGQAGSESAPVTSQAEAQSTAASQ